MPETPKVLTFCTEPGAIVIEAAAADAPDGESKTPKFSMIAYTGSVMRLAYWQFPVVIDLAGVKIPSQKLPVRMQHDAAMGIGHTESIAVADGVLRASGVISRDTEYAREAVASAKKGFPWQASIGAAPDSIEFVKAGAKGVANGREYDGPINIVRSCELGEISFVDRGADTATSASVAAAAAPGAFTEGGQEMPEDKKPDSAPVFNTLEAEASEHARIQAVEAMAVKYARECPQSIEAIREIASKAVEAKASLQDTELALLRATRARAPHEFTGAFSGGASKLTARHYQAALAIASKLPNLEKHYSADVLNAVADRHPNGLTTGELLMKAAADQGVRAVSLRSNSDLENVLHSAFDRRSIEAASTIAVPGILSAVANKFLLDSFNAVEDAWRLCAAIKPVSDFKTVTSYRLTGALEFQEVGPDGELKHGALAEESYTNRAKTFGKMLAITRQDIINDDLSAFSNIGRRLGRGGALALNRVFWTAFMDNAAFFTVALGNYSIGAGTALAAAGLRTMQTLFRKQTDADGTPIGLIPKVLVVPVDLEIQARELMTSTQFNTGGAAATEQVPNRNVWAGVFTVAASSYLSNAAFTGNSTAAWYLLADPRDLPMIEVAFLNGQETPIVESADADFNLLGIQFRGYYDFGVTKQDYRAAVKARGT